MVIAFEPQFNIGDVVCLKINLEKKMQVDSYLIRLIDRGKVTAFTYGVYDDSGTTYNYADLDLQIVEPIEANDTGE